MLGKDHLSKRRVVLLIEGSRDLVVIWEAPPALGFAHEGISLELTDEFHVKWHPRRPIVRFLFRLSMPLPLWDLKRIVQFRLIVCQIKVVAWLLLYRGLQRVLSLLLDNYTWALSLKRVHIEVLATLLRAVQGIYKLLERVGIPLAFKSFSGSPLGWMRGLGITTVI